MAVCRADCEKPNTTRFIDGRDGLDLPKGENAFYPYFAVDADNIIFDPDEFSKEAVDDDKYNLISDYNIYDHWTFSDAPDIIKKTKLYRLLEYLPKSISPVRGFTYIGAGKKDFIYSYQSYFCGRRIEDIIPLFDYLPLAF